MWPSTQDWISALYIIAPIYCTNGAPVLFGGGMPIDLGKILPDGEPVLGDHKTIRGFLSGLLVGAIVGLIESKISETSLFGMAILASIGALLGDLAGAFIKRRLRIKPGNSLPGVDQLDFVLGATIAVSWISVPTLGTLVILFCVTPPIHLFTNYCAYKLGLKSTYW
ncbi:MAG: CDP-2,3-bis-(O-geranylgeranyl)-sn-glycerol synthase [Candidatus Bathyarchaeia archaeon]